MEMKKKKKSYTELGEPDLEMLHALSSMQIQTPQHPFCEYSLDFLENPGKEKGAIKG